MPLDSTHNKLTLQWPHGLAACDADEFVSLSFIIYLQNGCKMLQEGETPDRDKHKVNDTIYY